MPRLVLSILGLLLAAAAYARAETAPAKATAQPNATLAAIPPGTALDLGAFVWEKPKGEPHTGQVTDYSGMTYDPHNHRILMFGGGHSATWTDAIYAFDFETLKWKALYTPTPHAHYTQDNMDKGWWKAGPEGHYPRPVGRHTYDLLVVPDDRPELLMLRSGTGPSAAAKGFGYIGGQGGAYDFATGKWRKIPAPFGGYGAVAEYDPESKKVIGQAKQNVYALDAVTGKYEIILRNIIDQHKVTAYSGTLAYCPLDKKMYAFPSKMKLWRLALDRANLKASKIEPLTPEGEGPAPKECGFVWDQDAKVFGGGVNGNKFYTYDPVKNVWAAHALQGAQPGHMIFHCLAYDPVDKVYIFVGGHPKNKYGKRMYAYRLPKTAAK